MEDWENNIHKALAHRIRRRIIKCLQEKNTLTFNDLLKCTSLHDHGRLGFHLRALKGLIEHDPSTNRYHLTDKGHSAGELLWEIQSTMTKDKLNLTHEPSRYVRRLSLGDHAVLFYNTEEIRHKLVYPFLETGLTKGEAVVYLVPENRLDSEKQEIQRHGIDFNNLDKEALTITSAEEWYLQKGKTQAETIINNWMTLLKNKQRTGFTGLRVATEMEVFFNYSKRKELIEYENALGRQLHPTLCGLCLYNTHKLEEQEFIQLNHNHGHSIFKGIAFKTI